MEEGEILNLMAKTGLKSISFVHDCRTENLLKIFVNVHTQSIFTQANLDTYDRLRNVEVHPRIFGTMAPKGMHEKHLGAMLIDMKKVEDANKYYNQMARFSTNPEETAIEEDILTNQFSLAELGIMVMKNPKKKGHWIVLEGRTRFRILQKSGMTNIIAEAFDEVSEADALRFATAQNAQKKPFGKASWTDIQKTILQLIDWGEIKGPDFVDAITYFRIEYHNHQT